jgi:membrane dipeptidase
LPGVFSGGRHGCCGQGHIFVPRQWVWSATLTPVGAMLAGAVGPRGSTTAARSAETGSAALEVLRKSISVDVHSHGGKQGSRRKRRRTTSSRTPCAPDRSRSPAWRTCPTVPSSTGIRKAFWPPCARPSPASFIGTISIERLAWVDEIVGNHGLLRALSAAGLDRAMPSRGTQSSAWPSTIRRPRRPCSSAGRRRICTGSPDPLNVGFLRRATGLR